MNPMRAMLAAAVVVGVLVWSVWQAGPSSSPPVQSSPPVVPSGPPELDGLAEADGSSPLLVGTTRFLLDAGRDPLSGLVGEGLNARGGSATEDLRIVAEILEAWQTNFPEEGNPVGLNREITRALTGTNRLGEAFVPASHPAINDEGELCDRWGSPLIFHQISKYHMELRSAGPDRIAYTDDDLVRDKAERF
jgi:hypothetical protein